MSIVELRVCGRYKLAERIGAGAFGQLFIGKNVQTYQNVAIKIEEIKSRYPQLLYEGKIMQNLQGGIGISTMYWCGQEGDYNFLVMELLGENLEELFELCDRKFSLKSVLMLAEQLISNIEYIHFKAYIHRDIKPENFLIGLNKMHKTFYTIDFGLSKRYRDFRTYEHIPFREKKPLISTARYASINSHKGYEQSRRDDMESIAYILVYFLKGKLPWQGIKCQNREEKYNKIKDMKINIPLNELCAGLPPEFAYFITECRNMKFEDKPDYSYFKKIFRERFIKEGFIYDYIYDWLLIPIKNKKTEIIPMIPINFECGENEEENNKYMQQLDFLSDLSSSLNEEDDEIDEEKVQNLDEQTQIAQQQDINIKQIDGFILQQQLKTNVLQQNNLQKNQKFQQSQIRQTNQIYKNTANQQELLNKRYNKQQKKNDCFIF
ncbi:hypothetical protein IMG5_196020 [Ichthyophthirius multifiliis]|uniref:Casein kinase I n=1 Tax=Ichthyophthirius multifiliis TaxID=5932 RepID=G0R518_ICHMU|nr:hypothetical protein IMG5_196020 [Ichthyophthirius multifiliis]EGR27420.1 hypothetical protein IMG5_196020 [Ichthyophthirius multifiliis]|eukprot:XP_004024330.1 hypothetical protein IMG5_196020 [Ichthyophthirius multifiliis]